MASNYPGGLDEFETIATDTQMSTTVGGRTHRDMHNDLGDAVEAVQTELGINPSGPYDSVEARLVALSAGSILPDPDAKGDIFVATSANDLDNLAVGDDGTVLLADSAETAGMKWGHGTKIEGYQTAENAVLSVVEVTPKTADFAPLSLRMNSFANTGGGAGTYNHAAGLGFNVGRHFGGDVVTAAPASFIGLEDNYFDPADDTTGPEFYWEVHPKSASDMFRPLYARAAISTDGTTVRRAAVLADIGTDGDGQFTVSAGAGGASPLFNVRDDSVATYVPFYVNAQAMAVSATGGAYVIADGTISANMSFRVGGSQEFSLRVFAGSLEITESVDTLFTLVTKRAAFAGVIAAGSGSATPTLSATANLGGSPPTPTISGNCSRGTVSFGTGTAATSAGAVVTVNIPSGYYAATPTVVLSAANFLTAQKLVYVIPVSATQFQIALGSAPAAEQAADTYAVSYQVIG